MRDKRARRVEREPVDASVPGFRETVAAFHDRFSAAYGGAKPTWGAKQGATLKRLLASHGAEEVQRRIGVLFESPPAWLQGPFDVGTLAQHFDKLVGANGSAVAAGAIGRFDPSMNPKDEDNEIPPWEL